MNVLWFRRDLRIDDNPALAAAIQSGPTRALFIATPDQWLQHDMAPIQVDFIERHLNLLAKQLSQYNIHLDVLVSTDFNQQTAVLKQYCLEHQVENLFANEELELNERLRDKSVTDSGISLHLFEADVIVPKGQVVNGKNEMYKVFTPFRNAWLNQLRNIGIGLAPHPASLLANTAEPAVQPMIELTANKQCSKKWPLADVVLKKVLPDFIETKHADYKQYRDFPAQKGTSGLSPYLAIGAISPKRLVIEVLQHNPHLLEDPKAELFCWLNELAWRDFYKHLLFHEPNLIKHHNFQDKYDALNWPNNPDYFEAWCQGKTGYPLVDAAMRQLTTTGWMHNRLRMVVASFLTKHLLVDWRLGEQFFMQHLIDGDFSANNGGWQWAAGTGCDAQPYFRVFNPITQSEKFDPDGSFIRKYLPELNDVPIKHIHLPQSYLAATGQLNCYWDVIVEHKQARATALDFYKHQLGST